VCVAVKLLNFEIVALTGMHGGCSCFTKRFALAARRIRSRGPYGSKVTAVPEVSM